jgi:hypothetical protein
MNDILKEFVKTYGPKVETLLVGGIGFAANAILLVLTSGQPNGGVLALVNIGWFAFANYVTSHARDLVTQDVQAESDAKVAAIVTPPAGTTNF